MKFLLNLVLLLVATCMLHADCFNKETQASCQADSVGCWWDSSKTAYGHACTAFSGNCSAVNASEPSQCTGAGQGSPAVQKCEYLTSTGQCINICSRLSNTDCENGDYPYCSRECVGYTSSGSGDQTACTSLGCTYTGPDGSGTCRWASCVNCNQFTNTARCPVGSYLGYGYQYECVLRQPATQTASQTCQRSCIYTHYSSVNGWNETSCKADQFCHWDGSGCSDAGACEVLHKSRSACVGNTSCYWFVDSGGYYCEINPGTETSVPDPTAPPAPPCTVNTSSATCAASRSGTTYCHYDSYIEKCQEFNSCEDVQTNNAADCENAGWRAGAATAGSWCTWKTAPAVSTTGCYETCGILPRCLFFTATGTTGDEATCNGYGGCTYVGTDGSGRCLNTTNPCYGYASTGAAGEKADCLAIPQCSYIGTDGSGTCFGNPSCSRADCKWNTDTNVCETFTTCTGLTQRDCASAGGGSTCVWDPTGTPACKSLSSLVSTLQCLSLTEPNCLISPYSTYCNWNSTACVDACWRLTANLDDCQGRADCYISGTSCYTGYHLDDCGWYGSDSGPCNADRDCYYNTDYGCTYFYTCGNLNGYEIGCTSAFSGRKRCIWDADNSLCLNEFDEYMGYVPDNLGCSGHLTQAYCNEDPECLWNGNYSGTTAFGTGVCVKFSSCADISSPEYNSPGTSCGSRSDCTWLGYGAGVCGAIGSCKSSATTYSCADLSYNLCSRISVSGTSCAWIDGSCKQVVTCNYQDSVSCDVDAGCYWNMFSSNCVLKTCDVFNSYSSYYPYTYSKDYCAKNTTCGWYGDGPSFRCRIKCSTYNNPDSEVAKSNCDSANYCYWGAASAGATPTCLDADEDFVSNLKCGSFSDPTNCEDPIWASNPPYLNCKWLSSNVADLSIGTCYDEYELKNLKVRGCDDITNAEQCDENKLTAYHVGSYGSCKYILTTPTTGSCVLLRSAQINNCSIYKVSSQCSEVSLCLWNTSRTPAVCEQYTYCSQFDGAANAAACDSASTCVRNITSNKCLEKCEFISAKGECTGRAECFWTYTGHSNGGTGAGVCSEFTTCNKAVKGENNPFLVTTDYGKNKRVCNEIRGCVWDSYTQTCEAQTCNGVLGTPNFGSFRNGGTDCTTKGCFWVYTDPNGTVGTCFENYDLAKITSCGNYTNMDSCNADHKLKGTAGCNGNAYKGCYWNSGNKCVPFEECADILDQYSCYQKAECDYDHGICGYKCQGLDASSADCENNPNCVVFGGECVARDSLDCSDIAENSLPNYRCDYKSGCLWNPTYSRCETIPGDSASYYNLNSYPYNNLNNAARCQKQSDDGYEWIGGYCTQTCRRYLQKDACTLDNSCAWDITAQSCITCYGCSNYSVNPNAYSYINSYVTGSRVAREWACKSKGFVFGGIGTGTCGSSSEVYECNVYSTAKACNENTDSCGFGCVWYRNVSSSPCRRFGYCGDIAYPQFAYPEDACNKKESCYWDAGTCKETITGCAGVTTAALCNNKSGCVYNGSCKTIEDYCSATTTACGTDAYCFCDYHFRPGVNQPFTYCSDITEEIECTRGSLRGMDHCYWYNGRCLEYERCSQIYSPQTCTAVSGCRWSSTDDCTDELTPIWQVTCDTIANPQACLEHSELANWETQSYDTCFWEYNTGVCVPFVECKSISSKANCVGVPSCIWGKFGNANQESCVLWNCSLLTNENECNNYAGDDCRYVWSSSKGTCVEFQYDQCGAFLNSTQCRSYLIPGIGEPCFWKKNDNQYGGNCYYSRVEAGVISCGDNCDEEDCANDLYGNCRWYGGKCQSLTCSSINNSKTCGDLENCIWDGKYNVNRGGCFDFNDCDDLNGMIVANNYTYEEHYPYNCAKLGNCFWNSLNNSCTAGVCSSATNAFDCNIKSYCYWNISLSFETVETPNYGSAYTPQFGMCTYFWGCNAIKELDDCEDKGCGWNAKDNTCEDSVPSPTKAKWSNGAIASTVVLAVLLFLAVVAVVVLVIFLILKNKSQTVGNSAGSTSDGGSSTDNLIGNKDSDGGAGSEEMQEPDKTTTEG